MDSQQLPANVQLAFEWGQSILQASKVILVTLVLTIYHSCLALIPSKYYPKKSIEKQTVLITGAGSGLGRLLAVKMADLGAKILALDIDETALNETLRLINKRKPDCEPKSYVCDLSNRENIYT
uniref:Uncharacterized protein n=1 Tax=Romanomermis culicivorax TaxID=13658 RepID=A0A915J148_ROMCU